MFLAKHFIYTLLELNVIPVSLAPAYHPCEKKVNDVRFGHKLQNKAAWRFRSLVYTDDKKSSSSSVRIITRPEKRRVPEFSFYLQTFRYTHHIQKMIFIS